LAREDIRFASGDEECGGWLYRPDGGTEPVPCIVLAHGFGALKEARLDAYAERFRDAGYAALVFDYRHFGTSGGEPRQVIDIGSQHEDWRAAVAHARGLDGVDPDRIALWGTSYSGGHVLVIASEDPGVAAVVSQTPHTSAPATLRSGGLVPMLRLTAAAIRDEMKALMRREPYLIPIVASPGEIGAMTSPDALPGYLALYPDGFEWRNEFAPRAALGLGFYSPGRRARSVRCPLLVQVGTNDVVTPPAPARRAARRAPRGELKEYPGGHFDIYVDGGFEHAVGDQLEFLARHLRPDGG
jgi:fermentation-respiration switch protein FrsA (DUF1100 family)